MTFDGRYHVLMSRSVIHYGSYPRQCGFNCIDGKFTDIVDSKCKHYLLSYWPTLDCIWLRKPMWTWDAQRPPMFPITPLWKCPVRTWLLCIRNGPWWLQILLQIGFCSQTFFDWTERVAINLLCIKFTFPTSIPCLSVSCFVTCCLRGVRCRGLTISHCIWVHLLHIYCMNWWIICLVWAKIVIAILYIDILIKMMYIYFPDVMLST